MKRIVIILIITSIFIVIGATIGIIFLVRHFKSQDQPPERCFWGDWDDWSDCSRTCEGGTMSRVKTQIGPDCDKPPKTQTQTRKCNTQPCPIDCAWSDWSISDCSVNCGSGYIEKKRHYINSKYTGKDCSFDTNKDCPGGQLNDTGSICTLPCNKGPCPVDCQWSDWNPFGECSAKCTVGGITPYKLKDRNKIGPFHGGKVCRIEPKDCPGGTLTDDGKTCKVPCNTKPCPSGSCVWSEWSKWSECKDEEQSRTRSKNKN